MRGRLGDGCREVSDGVPRRAVWWGPGGGEDGSAVRRVRRRSEDAESRIETSDSLMMRAGCVSGEGSDDECNLKKAKISLCSFFSVWKCSATAIRC